MAKQFTQTGRASATSAKLSLETYETLSPWPLRMLSSLVVQDLQVLYLPNFQSEDKAKTESLLIPLSSNKI